jgi:hypothetical protein
MARKGQEMPHWAFRRPLAETHNPLNQKYLQRIARSEIHAPASLPPFRGGGKVSLEGRAGVAGFAGMKGFACCNVVEARDVELLRAGWVAKEPAPHAQFPLVRQEGKEREIAEVLWRRRSDDLLARTKIKPAMDTDERPLRSRLAALRAKT